MSDSVFEMEYNSGNNDFSTIVNSATVVYPKPEWADELQEDLNNAIDYIDDLSVSAVGLDAGETPTVTKTLAVDHYNFEFGIPKGEKGDDGADGQDGRDGTDGQDGQSAIITVGTTTTLSAGSDATVTNSGTSSAAVLNFGIPKGDKGDTGPSGADGKYARPFRRLSGHSAGGRQILAGACVNRH